MVGSGSGIRDKQTKFVNSLYTKRGRIRDPVLFYPPDPGSGSGMEQWSDPDPGSGIKHPGSATLLRRIPVIHISVCRKYSIVELEVVFYKATN
jgi:hypothetical protein